jgi:hypothetical protein
VQLFLTEANKASVPISSTIINEFGEACKDAFKKQFTEERETKFKPRMSSIGKPLCQLQMEKKGAVAETPSYQSKMKFIFGDLVEALAIAILKSSGIKIDGFQKKVTHKFGKDKINGTYDAKILGKIWDIKSASPYSFKYKFSEGFDAILKDDIFGYVSQGYLYSEAEGVDFGGWIAIDKSSGEWAVVETPINDDKHAKQALEKAKSNLKALNNDEPFKRQYEDIEETFNGKPTGNRVLGKECSFCAYKKTCWEGLQHLPQQQSKAINPKYFWYTEITNPKEEYDNSSQ